MFALKVEEKNELYEGQEGDTQQLFEPVEGERRRGGEEQPAAERAVTTDSRESPFSAYLRSAAGYVRALAY